MTGYNARDQIIGKHGWTGEDLTEDDIRSDYYMSSGDKNRDAGETSYRTARLAWEEKQGAGVVVPITPNAQDLPAVEQPGPTTEPGATTLNSWLQGDGPKGEAIPTHVVTPFNVNLTPEGTYETKYGEIRSEDGETMAQAFSRVRQQRRAQDPDYVAKQLDGVIAPKPVLSPEHYHISYEIDNFTYPRTKQKFKKSRDAYLEVYRMAKQSKPEALFFEDGLVRIWTPVHGRTGLFSMFLRVVVCFMKNCRKIENPVTLVIPGKDQTGDSFRPASERLSLSDIDR